LKIAGIIAAIAACVALVVVFAKPAKPASEIYSEYVRIDKGIREAPKKKGKQEEGSYFSGRHDWVLKQVDAGNMPSCVTTFVTIKVTGTSGSVAEYQVAQCPLSIGNDQDWIEIALPGTYAAAAAEVAGGYTIETDEIVDAIYDQALKEGGKLPFLSDGAIMLNPLFEDDEGAEWKKLTEHKKGKYKKRPELFKARTTLLRKYMKDNDIGREALTTCSHKSIVWPTLGQTKKRYLKEKNRGQYPERLEMYLPTTCQHKSVKKKQGFSGGMHADFYFDYSHGVRFVKPTVQVDGKKVKFIDFFSSPEYAADFVFRRIWVRDGLPYVYPEFLRKWMSENGHLDSPDTDDDDDDEKEDKDKN